MIVRALNTYKELGVEDKELGRIPEENEEFEVSKERLEVLLGNNEYNKAFVEPVDGTVKESKETTEPQEEEETSEEEEEKSLDVPEEPQEEEETSEEPQEEEETEEEEEEKSLDVPEEPQEETEEKIKEETKQTSRKINNVKNM